MWTSSIYFSINDLTKQKQLSLYLLKSVKYTEIYSQTGIYLKIEKF